MPITVWPDNPMGWGAEGMKYRFQWTFPIVASRHARDVLYAAGNVLFRTTNEGPSWDAISPDLTRNDKTKLGPSGGPITKDNTGVEYYGTIFALAESPRDANVLWAGSDDGLVHVTRDGGKNWTNVTPKGMPEWSRVSQIDASAHDAGTAWLAVNRYQLDDYRPYAYVTTDFGATWRSVAAGLPADSFVRVLREDPVRRGLLFAGTETGIHVSFDSGASWQSLQRNLPAVPVTDLVVKDQDLVLATQGRSFWILDDIAALRQAKPELATAAAHLFAPSPAYRFGGPEGRGTVGKNPPAGARFQYLLKEAPKEGEEIKLEILDSKGALVRALSSKEEKKDDDANDPEREAFLGPPAPKTIPAKAGLNTFTWDLRSPEASKFKGLILWSGQTAGPRVVPGRYEARLTAAGQTQSQAFEVRKDPRLATSEADFAKQQELLLKIRDKLTRQPRRDHAAARRARPGEDGERAGQGERRREGDPGGRRRALEEAHGGRGGALPDEEPREPGPAQLPDPAQQQARGARRHSRQRGRGPDGAVVRGLRRAGGEDRRRARDARPGAGRRRAGLQPRGAREGDPGSPDREALKAAVAGYRSPSTRYRSLRARV